MASDSSIRRRPAAASARADSTGESPWRESRAPGGGHDSCGISQEFSPRNIGRHALPAGSRAGTPRGWRSRKEGGDPSQLLSLVDSADAHLCLSAADVSFRPRGKEVEEFGRLGWERRESARRGELLPTPEGPDVAVPRRTRSSGRQDGHQGRWRGQCRLGSWYLRTERVQHSVACFSCRGCPDRCRESRPLLHVAQGGERGPEASFCLSKMRPIFPQISIQVFLIIPVLYNKLQDGLLNVAGVGILLLKGPSVDIPLPLCLDSRDTSLP